MTLLSVACTYVVTDSTIMIRRHPGGSTVLLNFNGRDGTAAFLRTGHSPNARTLLKSMALATVTGTPPKVAAPQTTGQPIQPGAKRVLLPVEPPTDEGLEPGSC